MQINSLCLEEQRKRAAERRIQWIRTSRIISENDGVANKNMQLKQRKLQQAQTIGKTLRAHNCQCLQYDNYIWICVICAYSLAHSPLFAGVEFVIAQTLMFHNKSFIYNMHPFKYIQIMPFNAFNHYQIDGYGTSFVCRCLYEA